MFLLLFMTLEYPLILEIHLKLFQKQYNSLIKKNFPTYKKGKALKRVEGPSAPNESHHTAMVITLKSDSYLPKQLVLFASTKAL